MHTETLSLMSVYDGWGSHQLALRKRYAVSRQRTIRRILAHDLHHGGQIAILPGLQGIEISDLGDQGDLIKELPLAEPF